MTQKKWHRGGIIDLFQIFSQFIHSIWYYSTYWWDKFCISFSSPRKKAKKSESDSHRTVSNHITILLNQRNDSSFLILIEKSDFRCNFSFCINPALLKNRTSRFIFSHHRPLKKKVLTFIDIPWYLCTLCFSHFAPNHCMDEYIYIYEVWFRCDEGKGEALRGVRSRVGYTSEFIRRCVRSDVGPFRWLLVGDNLVTPR